MLCTGISQMSATTTKSTIYTSNRNPYNITQFQSGIGGWCYTCAIMQVDIVQLCFVLFRQQCLLRKYVQLPSVIPAIVYSGQCKQLHFYKENNEIAINDYCRIVFFCGWTYILGAAFTGNSINNMIYQILLYVAIIIFRSL